MRDLSHVAADALPGEQEWLRASMLSHGRRGVSPKQRQAEWNEVATQLPARYLRVLMRVRECSWGHGGRCPFEIVGEELGMHPDRVHAVVQQSLVWIERKLEWERRRRRLDATLASRRSASTAPRAARSIDRRGTRSRAKAPRRVVRVGLRAAARGPDDPEPEPPRYARLAAGASPCSDAAPNTTTAAPGVLTLTASARPGAAERSNT